MRRDLAGRAILIAAGVGTALGAGAGLANAAPLEQDLQQDQTGQNAFDQQSAAPTDALTGSLPAAPNLALTDGLTKTQTASPLDLTSVAGGDQLAALGGASGLLGGIGSNGGNAEEATAPESESGASDQASDATESTSEDNDTAAPASSGAQGSEGNATDTKAGSEHTAASDSAQEGEYSSSYGTS